MTDTPVVNDIPAILARVNAATLGPIEILQGERLSDALERQKAAKTSRDNLLQVDVPNMAAEILSLRAQLAEQKEITEKVFGERQSLRIEVENWRGLRDKFAALEAYYPAVGRLLESEPRVWKACVSLLAAWRDIDPKYLEAADAELLSRREKENG